MWLLKINFCLIFLIFFQILSQSIAYKINYFNNKILKEKPTSKWESLKILLIKNPRLPEIPPEIYVGFIFSI